MNTDRYRTVPFRKCAAMVFEWDPAEHGGEREPWESIEATLDAQWAEFLVGHQAQETASGHRTERHTDFLTDQRSVRRIAWTLSTDVPADIARCADPDSLKGYLTWDPEPIEPAWLA